MSKLDRYPRYSNAKGKTLHDMSYDFKFTCTSGHLNPVNSDILLPGDKIDFQPTFQVRCAQPLLAAAMVDIDFHVETFFVPMTMLWTPFEDFIYQVNGNYSSSYVNSNKMRLPLFDGPTVQNLICSNIDRPVIPNDTYLGDCYGQSYVRLATLLGLNPFVSKYTSLPQPLPSKFSGYVNAGHSPKVFPWALLAYNCIFQNYYRLDDYTTYRQSRFNVDASTASGVIPFATMTAGDDTPPMFCMQYRPCYKDYFTSVKKSPLLNEKNLLGNISASQIGDGLLNVYGDLSYQQITKLFNPSGMPFGNSDNVNNVNGLNSSPTSLGNVAVVSNGNDIEQSFNGVSSGGSFQSTAQLRSLFANEKLLMITNRARKNYDSQTLAHFGVSVPHDVKHEITLLGSDTFKLSINELVSTAATEQAALGEYYGKGLAGKQTRRVKFTAPCHGVLMTIFSCVPHYDYLVDFQKKNLIQNRLNFFQPEYDALGMQPIFRFETSSISPFGAGDLANTFLVSREWAFDIQGWQYRYEEFKRNINRATYAFAGGVYSAWALTRHPYSRFTSGQLYGAVGSGYTYNGGSNLTSFDYYLKNGSFLYVTAHDLDQLFSGNYFTGWKNDSDESAEDYENWDYQLYNVFSRDPFVVNSRMNYKKFSIMSTYSMPKLD